MFIEKISKKNKPINFQQKRLISNIDNKDLKLYKFIDSYFKTYCKFNKISIDQIINLRKKFLVNYLKNLNNFEKSKKYSNLNKNFNLTRIEYDIVLLLSILIEEHRFKIINLFSKEKFKEEDVLIIGSGPSIELAILRFYLKHKMTIEAYDLNFNSFIKKKFIRECKVSEYKYKKKKYSKIVLIEFLEHINKPYHFLYRLKKSLKKNGKILLTTAINIPQFDHIYNFKKREILKKIQLMGYKKKEYSYIKHKMFISKVKSANEYIVLMK
jgi:hypothetical protein